MFDDKYLLISQTLVVNLQVIDQWVLFQQSNIIKQVFRRKTLVIKMMNVGGPRRQQFVSGA